MRIRAILSWSVAPPCANPNYVPTWGNREETLINIAPVEQEPAGHIAILGGIPVSKIDNISATFHGPHHARCGLRHQQPAARRIRQALPVRGRVTVQGAPMIGYSYIVEVTPDGLGVAPVLTDLVVTDQFGTTSVHTANPVTKRFTYLDFTQTSTHCWPSGTRQAMPCGR